MYGSKMYISEGIFNACVCKCLRLLDIEISATCYEFAIDFFDRRNFTVFLFV